jgi:hypothetical protein
MTPDLGTSHAVGAIDLRRFFSTALHQLGITALDVFNFPTEASFVKREGCFAFPIETKIRSQLHGG